MSLNKFKTFIKLPFKKKIVVLEALFWLPVMKIIIQFVPMRVYTPVFLGRVSVESSKTVIEDNIELFENMRWALNVISNKMPWKKKCFALAMAAKMMLRYRNITTTLYLGISKKDMNSFGAHAWLRAGNFYVTGGDGSGYTVISYFT